MQSDSRGDTLKRITKTALGGLASCALIVGGTQVAMSSAVNYFPYLDDLVDLPLVKGPFDAASAALRVKVTPDGTNFKLEVSDIATSADGDVFGAHLHTDACDDSSSPPAFQPGGPHYNHEVVVGGKAFPGPDVLDPAEVSPRTEVWFSFVPNAHGDATDDTFVPFVPVDADGDMSIVVHMLPTNPETGLAGGRQACFPIDDVSDWAPTTP